MHRAITPQPPFAMLLASAWLVVACILLTQEWAATGSTMPDADDAMRLTQMRAFLAGRGWFDLHEPRIAPPLGYDSHWSRLIDVGLAGLYGAFRLFAEPAMAERLMRAAWPLLWLIPTMFGAVAIAWRLAGRDAALVVLLLLLIGAPAYQQFRPGRIDHHNVQIALSVLILAAAAWAGRRRWAASAAGALSGLALAIGLESLPYVAACGVAFALRYVIDSNAARALRAYAGALVVTTLAAFLVSVAPDHWRQAACDALAVNLAAAVVVGGFALALIGALPVASRAARALMVAAAATATFGVFVAIEPRCIGGPYAMMDPAVWAVWLDNVPEMQPLVRLWHKMPLVAVAIAAFPAAALLAAVALARDPELRRDPAFLLVAVTCGLAGATTLLATKAFSYAIWFGVPLVAVAALRLAAALRLTSVAARVLLGLLLTPTAVSAGAIIMTEAAGFHDADTVLTDDDRACRDARNYEPLTRLPPGIVVTDTRNGPFFLAWTPHSALSAPYHRLSAAILTGHRAVATAPEEARGVVLGAGVAYVVVCGRAETADRPGTLWARLKAGSAPDWLEPVPETEGRPLRVFRVRR